MYSTRGFARNSETFNSGTAAGSALPVDINASVAKDMRAAIVEEGERNPNW